MSDVQTMRKLLDNYDAEIRALQASRDALARTIDSIASREFIKATGMTRADVHIPGHDPWFGIITEFGKWISKQHYQRPYCAWNGRIYYTSSVVSGGMKETPARLEDVPE